MLAGKYSILADFPVYTNGFAIADKHILVLE